MRDFDITGFVNFPTSPSRIFQSVDSGATHVYLISFGDKRQCKVVQSINLIGTFCGDDTTPVRQLTTDLLEIDQIVDQIKKETNTEDLYFTNGKSSVPLVSCTLIGWSRYSYEYVNRFDPWCCSFRDLTPEGRKFYYAVKKLHNEKEVRILTFNNIK